MKYSKLEKSRREQLVRLVIKRAIDYVVGGYENSVNDGHRDKMPSTIDMMDEVYGEVMSTKALDLNGALIPVRKDIRFLGKERIREMITQAI